MRRGAKPGKANVEAKPPVARRSPKSEGFKVQELEKGLAESLGQLQQRSRELVEAQEQQKATSEILRIISSSPTDVQPVFEAIADSAMHLFDALGVAVVRYDRWQIRMAAARGGAPGSAAAATERFRAPHRPITGFPPEQTVLTRTMHHIADVDTDPSCSDAFRRHASERGFRSVLSMPMLRGGDPVGVIVVSRAQPGTFSAAEVELLHTFADQAVIAIENVRLFNETKEALEQQTATSEILRVINSSRSDVQPVFDAIVRSAVRLCDGLYGTAHRFEGDLLHLTAHHNCSPEVLKALQQAFPMRPDRRMMSGRAVLTRAIVHVEDVLADPEYARHIGRTGGFRGVLAVPMLRDGEPIGAIVVIRGWPGPFSETQIELLKTFADQAVIAIENVRLFRELEAKNADLAEKSRQLEAASQYKSEFLANMSHELRTPLNAIMGFSEVLNDRMFGELNDKQAEYLTDIHASGQHLLSLINDILDLSKIEAGRMELELADINLPAALDNALTLIRERAGRRGISLNLTVDERLGQICADERKVRQVVLNLLSNAIKFTPAGGRIEVRAVRVDGAIEVSVSDTGVGIAPEDQEAIFEEFRQVGTAAKKVEGAGLGLALSRKFIELHGGRIWVTSQVGAGSTFTFTIPMRQWCRRRTMELASALTDPARPPVCLQRAI